MQFNSNPMSEDVVCAAAERFSWRGLLISLTIAVLFCGGCSNRPSSLSMPNIDADVVAQGAMDAYDLNGDGVISGEELKHPSFGFSHSLSMLDADGDRSVNQDEIRDYVQRFWINAGAALTSTKCRIRFGGKPLPGATVVFEPVEFMKDVIRPASGKTRGSIAYLDLADEDRPHENAHGAQCGLYVVRISKVVNGKETVPEEYNTNSILGCEVAARAGYKPGPVTFDLKRR